jgi:EAL domain-containing protein (putative c-di-GMP-specific phosphodiesterase class I)
MNLPIQTVKLDRSLIADVGRDARVSKLVSALLHTARALGVSITAEGVEEAGQAAFLRNAGCEHMQGYLFARPMPAVEMDAMLRAVAAPLVQQDLSQRVA